MKVRNNKEGPSLEYHPERALQVKLGGSLAVVLQPPVCPSGCLVVGQTEEGSTNGASFTNVYMPEEPEGTSESGGGQGNVTAGGHRGGGRHEVLLG